MKRAAQRILVIGYGNPGRLDDGLGPAFADAARRLRLPGVTVESNYQLNVEDAQTIAGHDVVVFADASVTGPDPYELRRVEPRPESSFSTHSLSPEAVLALAHRCFAVRTRGYLLAIRGHAFDAFGEELSERARENLRTAVEFILPLLSSGDFESGVTDAAPRPDAASMPVTGKSHG